MLKLSLPGLNSATIPTLTAEQVAQIPAEFLEFLHDCGRVEDYGDLKIINLRDERHNYTILSIAAWIANGHLEHDEVKVERLKNTDLEPVPEPIEYDQETHMGDAGFVATRDTHAHFLQRLDLYMFSIRAGMADLQAYLSKTIRTDYPVYEAELVALLTAVSTYTDDLSDLDPDLASFVSERMSCLRDILATNKAVLPLLCKTISAKDRFLALASRADPSVLALALAELREDVGEVAETHALLDVFIEQNSFEEDTDQPTQQASLATPSTQAKRKRGRPSGVKPQAKAAKLGFAAAKTTTAGKGGATTPHVAERDPSAELVSTPTDGGGRLNSTDLTRGQVNTGAGDGAVNTHPSARPRDRRPRPGHSMAVSRPQVDNEYWSVTAEQWADMPGHARRKFTHASNICETEAGVVALEPCSTCRDAGHICEVYTSHALHGNLGKSCARCRIHYGRNNLICSHSSGLTRGIADGA